MHVLHCALLLATTAVAQYPDLSNPPKCVDGVQVITSCGTGQTGYGTLDALTQNILNAIPNSASVALDYPADQDPYYSSVNSGVNVLSSYISYYVDACPNVQLVLLGYSQGAHVSLGYIRCGTFQAIDTANRSAYRHYADGRPTMI